MATAKRPSVAALIKGIRQLFTRSSDSAWRDHIKATVAELRIPD
jgi:hypothetical protein